MPRPSLAAVVLNWNGAHLLRDCLESLKSQDYPNLQIVVADNGSSDDSAEVTSELGVRFLPLGRNLGYSGGNNAASRHLDTEFLVFLNNDMRFEPNFASALVAPAEGDPSIFCCDARRLDWEGERQIHGAIRLRWSGSPRALFPFLAAYQTDRAGEVPWGCGANLLVRKWMFDELEGFEDELWFDLDSTDLCWRAWLRGWRTVHVPEATAFHMVAASFRNPQVKAIRRGSQAKNEVLVAVRVLPGWLAALTLLRSFLRLGWILLRLDFPEAKTRGRGVWAAVRLAPKALRDRRAIGRSAMVARGVLLRSFTR